MMGPATHRLREPPAGQRDIRPGRRASARGPEVLSNGPSRPPRGQPGPFLEDPELLLLCVGVLTINPIACPVSLVNRPPAHQRPAWEESLNSAPSDASP
ncbi:hypothetical protein CMUS01_02150 [Colletotrichum musicola]|uniref:Uncharacterized protein n=1 Tax=Colletotrichum musicola TaxID=2175873 RepID=A0A8H6NVM4_9PEZI|nr:hypothetical protein CMUS01_02150 [Colletotrichum musicola]